MTYGRSLEADLARRDFTVNAIAARLPSLDLVDPFGGMRDLRARVLRTPGRPEDSFNDDALRMLRAARFAAQLGFAVEPGVQAAMTAMAGRLSVVSAERISGELTKLLCSPGPDGPVRGISVLVDTGVAEQVLPEVPKLRLERDEHFRHKDVYQHTLTVLARATTLEAAYGLENDLVVRLAALLHDIGKPKTRRKLPGGRVAFHHHEAGRGGDGQGPAHRASFPLGRGLGCVRACRAAPAVPRLWGGGVDRFGRTALRAGRGPPADPAARADPGGLHDKEQGQGTAPGAAPTTTWRSGSPRCRCRRNLTGSGRT